MTTFRLVIFTFIFLAAAIPSFSEEQNYCHDKAAAQEWDALVKKDPNDLALQRLHALRLGICEKIENGSLTLDQGIEMFEREREKVVEERFEENRSRKKDLVQ